MPTTEAHEVAIKHVGGISIAALIIACFAFIIIMVIMLMAYVKNNQSSSGGSGSSSNNRPGPMSTASSMNASTFGPSMMSKAPSNFSMSGMANMANMAGKSTFMR